MSHPAAGLELEAGYRTLSPIVNTLFSLIDFLWKGQTSRSFDFFVVVAHQQILIESTGIWSFNTQSTVDVILTHVACQFRVHTKIRKNKKGTMIVGVS